MRPEKVCDILIRIIDEDWHVYTDDAINALKYAAKVVEKEIPKKRIVDNSVYLCPSCRVTAFRVTEYQHYCPYCGQKLNWEEKDD